MVAGNTGRHSDERAGAFTGYAQSRLFEPETLQLAHRQILVTPVATLLANGAGQFSAVGALAAERTAAQRRRACRLLGAVLSPQLLVSKCADRRTASVDAKPVANAAASAGS